MHTADRDRLRKELLKTWGDQGNFFQ